MNPDPIPDPIDIDFDEQTDPVIDFVTPLLQGVAGHAPEPERDQTQYPLRSEWGDGPWQQEPDREEWRIDGAPGVALLAVRSELGAWCGYAGVTEGHPWFGKTCLDNILGLEEWQPHGGITYGDACAGHVCHVPREGESDNVWWLGFDCAHSGDLVPGLVAFSRRREMTKLRGGPCSAFDGDVYRPLEYVKAECERLAIVAAIAPKLAELGAGDAA